MEIINCEKLLFLYACIINSANLFVAPMKFCGFGPVREKNRLNLSFYVLNATTIKRVFQELRKVEHRLAVCNVCNATCRRGSRPVCNVCKRM